MWARAQLLGTWLSCWVSLDTSTLTHAHVLFSDDAPYRRVAWSDLREI